MIKSKVLSTNIIFVMLSILVSSIAISQDNSRIDSLRKEIAITVDKSIKVELLDMLGEEYSLVKHDSLYVIANALVELADELNDPCRKSTGYFYIGNYYSYHSEINEALNYYTKSFELRKSNCTKDKVASALMQMGNMHGHLGEYEMAYKYYYQSLNLYESIEDWGGVSYLYSNLGVLDVEREKYESAKENYTLALEAELKCEEPDSINVGNIYNNFGGLYEAKGIYDTAIFYFQKAMNTYQLIDHKSGLAHGYNNIGIIYYYDGHEDSTMSYFMRSLQIRKEIGDDRNTSQSYNNIGILYMYEENYGKALAYADSSLSMARKGGYKEEVSEALFNKYEIYFNWGEYYEATVNLLEYSEYKDSLVAEESERSINTLNTKYATMKREKELQEKNLAIEQHEASSKRKNLIIGAAIIITALLGGLFWIVYSRNKITSQQNKIIEEQKVIVEKKQTEIIDSIRYAKRIQEALLKSEEHESQHLPDHFVLFKPKDIVSGDFYWVSERENYLYVAVGDCTGHGVPGGFLTMLGCSFLNEIVSSDKIFEPSEILDELRSRIVKELSQTGEIGENRDGMDISLMRLDLKTLELHWSGANNPLWIVREGGGKIDKLADKDIVYENMLEFRPDKMPIGHHWVMDPYTNRAVQLDKGDVLYLFSDGYVDQFGGEEGKKFKHKNFKNLVLRLQKWDMKDRKSHLDKVLVEWMGNYEQIDDVCVLGLRI